MADSPGIPFGSADADFPRARREKLRRSRGLRFFRATLAALYGTLVAIPLLLAKKRSLLSRLPFGPYLSLGAFTWLFWGHRLAAAYLSFSAPWRVDPFRAAGTVLERAVPLPF